MANKDLSCWNKRSQVLDHYVNHYNSIELNATHYRTFPPPTAEKWAERAGDKDFLFCPKIPQSISHYSTFEKTNAFLEGFYAFGKHLGPIFLQVSNRFSPYCLTCVHLKLSQV